MAISELSSNDYVVAAAIDVGLYESSIAFSFTSHHDDVKLLKINPTSVLIAPAGLFHSFGFEAETRYKEFQAEGKAGGPNGYNLYSDFTMVLGRPDVTLQSTIVSLDGYIMKALDIFVMVLQYMIRCMLDAIAEKTTWGISPRYIRWVLTVPDIWKDESKLFLEEVAAKAGMYSDRVLLTPASTAVLKYFLHEVVNIQGEEKIASFQPGDQILIIIAQANETTFSSYEIQKTSEEKRVLVSTQIPWGLKSVTKNFVKLMTKIFGDACINSFISTYPELWAYVLNDFESLFVTKQKMKLQLPHAFQTEVLKVNSMDAGQLVGQYKNGISLSNGYLKISSHARVALFSDSLSNIIQETQELLNKPALRGIKYIGLAGRFVSYSILQRAFQDDFGDSKKILVPLEPHTAILLGAVHHGHKKQ